MKSNFSFTSMVLVIFFFIIVNLSSAATIIKRDDTSTPVAIGDDIAETFQQIDDVIHGLDLAQSSSPQSGTPMFQKAAAGLENLGMLAEKADGQVNALEINTLLDEGPLEKIKVSLNDSAYSVISITTMIEGGKEWFKQGNITETIIVILQLNAFQFVNLYSDLNLHRPVQYIEDFAKSEGLFVCSIVFAMNELDEKSVAKEAVKTCKVQKKLGYSTFDPSIFKIWFIAPPFTPPGFTSSCYQSTTTYLSSAYKQNTLKAVHTFCGSKQLQANTFLVPKNALMI